MREFVRRRRLRSIHSDMDLQILRLRARFVQAVRGFFIDRGYLEVETPVLSPALIPEAALEVFETEYLAPSGERRPLYLIPSPELWMKRLVAHGAGSLFQITKSFRNGETMERVHNPEFTLLEWYTVGSDYLDSIRVQEQLILHLQDQLPVSNRLRPPFQRLTMREAFRRYASLELDDLMDRKGIRSAASRAGVSFGEEDRWEDIFHAVFLSCVEPEIPRREPVILLDYPSGIPTLSWRRGRYTERWELYIGGVEIANCYTEETRSEEVRRFFAGETERKRGDCCILHPIDEGFVDLFDGGFPPCSGVALGMDRLFMVLLGLCSINRVIPFPFSEFFSSR